MDSAIFLGYEERKFGMDTVYLYIRYGYGLSFDYLLDPMKKWAFRLGLIATDWEYCRVTAPSAEVSGLVSVYRENQSSFTRK